MSNASETAAACPRCQGVLADPTGLGWCQKCGYCRTLEEERSRMPMSAPPTGPQPQRRTSLGGLVDLGVIVAWLPSWFFVLLAGMIMFALFSLLPAKKLAPHSLERAIWTTSQIGGGLLLILTVQFWALVQIAPEDERLGIRDVLLPMRLWGLVFKRLPAMRMHVWLAGWALSMMLSAVILVGGLSYWMKYLPNHKTGQNNAHVFR